jgi:hypothetical protein
LIGPATSVASTENTASSTEQRMIGNSHDLIKRV